MSDDNDVFGNIVNIKREWKQKGGYPCPFCGETIHISLFQILEGEHLTCPVCEYEINFRDDDMKQRNYIKNHDKSQ